MVTTLIEEFKCNTHIRGRHGRSFLHSACANGQSSVVRAAGSYMPPSLMEDVRGDTPLHLAAASGDRECVEAVLQLNNLALVRNRNGKTPVDVARGRTKAVLDEYVDLKKIAYTLSDLKSVSDDVSDITDKELADRFQAISIGEFKFVVLYQ